MYSGKALAVVIPAYNEELLIADAIKSVPGFIDKVYVVDDGSTDRLAKDIYFDMTCLLSQLLLSYEILVIGMKRIEKGYSEARGCAQPAAGRNISRGVKFHSFLDAGESECCLEDTMFYVSYIVPNLHLRIAEADTVIKPPVSQDGAIFIDCPSD